MILRTSSTLSPSSEDDSEVIDNSKTCYVLRLYISGATPHSLAAVKNVTELCEKYLKDRYDLEIIDIYQKPQAAKQAQIIAVPTLIKCLPEPMRRLIGDMSASKKVIAGLDIETSYL